MRKVIRTDARFKIRGNWWLPDKPEIKASGTCRFDPKGGCTLRLVGSLSFTEVQDALQASFVGPWPNYPLIYGNGSDGTEVTLFDSWPQNASVDEERIFANRALIGGHCSDRNMSSYVAIYVRLHNLEQWFDHYVFTPESGFGPDIAKRDQLTAFVKDEAMADVGGELPAIDGNCEFVRGLSGTKGSHSASCEYQAQLRINFHNPKGLDEAHEIAGRVVNLFTLLMRAPAYSYELQLVEGQSKQKSTMLAPRRWNVRPRKVNKFEMPCPFERIGVDLVKTLDGWLSVSQELDLVVALLFEVLQVKGAVLESRFFTIAQALEGLCAKAIPFEYESADDFNKIHDAIVDAIPENTDSGLRSRVKSWLKYANRPSLRGYITRLFRELDAALKSNVLGDWNEDAFIDYAVDVRNTITHPSSGSVWDRTDHEQFRDVMDRMKLLVIVKLLERSGVPLEILRERYKDPGRWTWA